MNIADDLVKAFNDGYENGKAEAGEKISKLERELRTCRNELCLRCGEYRQRHLGACDGCRWLEDKT